MSHEAGPQGLWDALQATGLQELAPLLVRHGIRSLPDVARRFNQLTAAGFTPAQLQQLCERPMGSALAPSIAPRRDFPAVRDGAGASLQLALQAAQPQQQEGSLRALGQDMLAPYIGHQSIAD